MRELADEALKERLNLNVELAVPSLIPVGSSRDWCLLGVMAPTRHQSLGRTVRLPRA